MTISYPLALPAQGFASVSVGVIDVVGVGESPFTLSAQFQQHAGQQWMADVRYPPLRDVDVAEAVITFLVSLKGIWGSFLMPADPLRSSPRGTWAGAPQVMGAHSARSATLALDGFTAGATVKAGDYVQVGTGSTTHLHKALANATANGSGQATLDIWPNLRFALVDNDAIVVTAAKGLWRLADNRRQWDIGLAQRYGVTFSAVEKLT